MIDKELSDLTVAVVGAGGTGSYICHSLAKLKVKKLIIIDGDKVEESNLMRNCGYYPGTIGINKAIALKNILSQLTNVEAINKFLHDGIFYDKEIKEKLKNVDFWFMCVDNTASRKLISNYLELSKFHYIDVGCGATLGNSTVTRVRVTYVEPGKSLKDYYVFPQVDPSGYSNENPEQQFEDMNMINGAMAITKFKWLLKHYKEGGGHWNHLIFHPIALEFKEKKY